MMRHLVGRGLGEDVGQISLTLGTPLASGAAAVGAGALSAGGLTAGALATAGITAGIGLAAAAIALWLGRAGPRQNVASTHIVDSAEPLLQQNLAAWQSSNKSCANQAQALANFDSVWNAVVANCAVPALGDPGHSCLDDRLPAGVTFTFNSFHIVGNGMYDWFAWYREPIANDPAAGNCCPSLPCYFPGCVSAPQPGCVPAAASSPLAFIGASSASAPIAAGSFLLPLALVGLLIWGFSS
jgi:hypothetical protein